LRKSLIYFLLIKDKLVILRKSLIYFLLIKDKLAILCKSINLSFCVNH